MIHVFSLEEDNTLALTSSHPITEGSYGYSCLAPLGEEFALLYESGQGEITFRRIGIM